MDIIDKKQLDACKKIQGQLKTKKYIWYDEKLKVAMNGEQLCFFGNAMKGFKIPLEDRLEMDENGSWWYDTMRNMVKGTQRYDKNMFDVVSFKTAKDYETAKKRIASKEKRISEIKSLPTIHIGKHLVDGSKLGNFTKKYEFRQMLDFSARNNLFTFNRGQKISFSYMRTSNFKESHLQSSQTRKFFHVTLHSNYGSRLDQMVHEKKGLDEVAESKVMAYVVPTSAIYRVDFHDFNFVKPEIKDYLDYVSYYKYNPTEESKLKEELKLNIAYDIDDDPYA